MVIGTTKLVRKKQVNIKHVANLKKVVIVLIMLHKKMDG